MQTDDDLQTTLSKWPFILGDALLVGTALAIAILGDWQLTDWQVASCVISVALGAGLFVLPYIVEYQVRVREEAEDRTAELRSLRRQFGSAEVEVEAVKQRMRAVDQNLQELGQRVDEATEPIDLTAPYQALAAKLAPLTEASAAQQAELQSLREQILELTNSGLAVPPDTNREAEATSVEEPPLAPDHKAAISRPERLPRKRRTIEPRMLQRAIEQKQDSASAAVSRIIGGKPTPPDPVPADAEPPTPPDAIPEDTESSIPPDSIPADTEPPMPPDPVPADTEPPITPDLFAETVPPQPGKPRPTKKRDTAVIASVFIGIGNKPYLRGSGAGLNWEQGVAMEFEEIGKWRWIAPEELAEPVELQIFRNDEDADQNGRHTLEPGQQLEISPSF